MENQPKLNSSKEVIAFLAERFPQCFSAEGEARPLKVGIFQDLVERVGGEMNLSKTQLRAALRLYTSSWRYLYGVKPGAVRVDLDGNPCGELEEQHVAHARQQLEEAKARVQAQRASQQAKKREAAAAAGQQEDGARRERKPRPQVRRKEGTEQRKPRPAVAKAPREERHTPCIRSDRVKRWPGSEGESRQQRNGRHRSGNHQRWRSCTADFWYVNDCTRRTPGVLKRRPGQA